MCRFCEGLRGKGPVKIVSGLKYTIDGDETCCCSPVFYCPVCGSKLCEPRMDWLAWFEEATRTPGTGG